MDLSETGDGAVIGGAGGVKLGAGDGGGFEEFRQTFVIRTEVVGLGTGALDSGLGGGNLLGARTGEEFVEGGLSGLDSGLGGSYLLGTRTGEEFVEGGLRGADIGRGNGNEAGKFGVVEAGDESVLFDDVAFVDSTLDDAAGDFEGDFGVDDFDIA